uniref:Uncharacterized protein n=1 Tax=Anguilla anguilla TaxID=7936 RepID=A0A0E9U6S4_ANGAN
MPKLHCFALFVKFFSAIIHSHLISIYKWLSISNCHW